MHKAVSFGVQPFALAGFSQGSGDHPPFVSLKSPRPEVQAGPCHPDKTDEFTSPRAEKVTGSCEAKGPKGELQCASRELPKIT